MVEHDLAKVGVASSSLVFRSKQNASLQVGVFVMTETRTKRPQRHQPLAEAVAGTCAIAGRSGGVWGGAPVNTNEFESRFPLPVMKICLTARCRAYFFFTISPKLGQIPHILLLFYTCCLAQTQVDERVIKGPKNEFESDKTPTLWPFMLGSLDLLQSL